jgi:ABC-type multidrug transport system ATPase subunit
MNNDHAIRALNLTKYYDELLAVDDISFDVHSGEVFGFPSAVDRSCRVS